MAETHVLFALKRKFARKLGERYAGIGDSAEVAMDLHALRRVIKLFSPVEDLTAIAPIRTYKARRERWSGTVLVVLRRAERPLRACEIARRVMVERGIDLSDLARLHSIASSLQAILQRLADQGLVSITGKPRRWAILR